MTISENNTLAVKYIVDDLAGARKIGSRLHGIINNIETGKTVSQLARDYLAKSGLSCLLALVEGQIDLDTFNHNAVIERRLRIEQTDLAVRKAAAEAATLKAERAAASAAIFNDPAYKRKQEAQQLRRKFGLGFVKPEHYPRVIRQLKLLEKGKRLIPKDAIWLQIEAEYCWTEQVASAWHKIEAEALTEAWTMTGDPWAAVNASSHWRKCGQPEVALRLSEDAFTAAKASSAKVQSALATTRGGALRDVNRYAEAQSAGERAHLLMPKDYRPCTLLGAVYIGQNDFVAGYEWSKKAEGLGAPQAIVDHDIKTSLARLPKIERERLQTFLLENEPERFYWINTAQRHSHR